MFPLRFLDELGFFNTGLYSKPRPETLILSPPFGSGARGLAYSFFFFFLFCINYIKMKSIWANAVILMQFVALMSQFMSSQKMFCLFCLVAMGLSGLGHSFNSGSSNLETLCLFLIWRYWEWDSGRRWEKKFNKSKNC